MKLPEVKAWIQCRPSETLKTSIPHHHIRIWLQYFCQVPLFQTGSKRAPPQCATDIDVYGDHLLHFERGTHRMARHDEQVWILVGDPPKSARHPVLETRPLGRHREKPDIRDIGGHGSSDFFGITFCHPVTPARIRFRTKSHTDKICLKILILPAWIHTAQTTKMLHTTENRKQLSRPYLDHLNAIKPSYRLVRGLFWYMRLLQKKKTEDKKCR